MKAWRADEGRRIAGLAIKDLPVPSPGPGELLVRVEAAALNFSDLLMIEDRYQVRPPRPFTPGQEIAGTVIDAGGCASFAPGARIASKVLWGGFAEYAIVRCDMALPVPERRSFAEAVALPVVYTTALIALTESTKLAWGQTVLVHAAAGGAGLAAVQVAKALGARVIGTAGNAERCALAVRHGADLAFDYRSEDWTAEVLAATSGAGVDIIFDPVGGKVTIQSLKCLACNGELLIVGFASGAVPAIPAHRLLLKRAVARGVYWDHDRDGEMLERVTVRLVELYEGGKIRPVVNADYRFEDLPRALSDLRERRGVGKLALTMTSAVTPTSS